MSNRETKKIILGQYRAKVSTITLGRISKQYIYIYCNNKKEVINFYSKRPDNIFIKNVYKNNDNTFTIYAEKKGKTPGYMQYRLPLEWFNK